MHPIGTAPYPPSKKINKPALERSGAVAVTAVVALFSAHRCNQKSKNDLLVYHNALVLNLFHNYYQYK